MNRQSETYNKIAVFIGKTVITACLYFIASLTGSIFGVNGNQIPILWPQAGVGLAMVLLFGSSTQFGIFVGSFLTALVSGVDLPFAFFHALGNLLSVYLVSHFLLQQKDFSSKLDNYQTIFSLIFFGVIVGPFITSLVDVLSLYFFHSNPIDLLPGIWTSRWVRSALGVLIFTPPIIVWAGNDLPKFENKKILEGLVIFTIILAIGVFLFFGNCPIEIVYPISFLIIPLVIWAAVRIEVHGTSLINFTTSLIFLWGIAKERGILFNGSDIQIVTLICIIGTMLFTSFVISTSMSKLTSTQKTLSYLSTHDTLTNLYNRLFFETEFKRLESGRQYPISIIMADIDSLKYINDNFGHEAGDQVLITISALLSDVLRSDDIVSRYGGDEFVILLPDTEAKVAKRIIKRVKEKITNYNKKHVDLPINLSMGVSTANQGDSLGEHLKLADERMYEEKQKNKRR